MRDLLLILHIVGVAAWLGANLTQAVVTPQMQRSGHPAAAAWMRATVFMARGLYSVAAIVIIVTGIGLVLVSEGAYRFLDPFVIIGVVAIVTGVVVGVRIFGPLGRRAAELHEAGGAPELAGLHGRIAAFGALDTLIVVVALVAMVLRLGA